MKDKKNIVIMAWRDMWHPGAGGAEVYIYKIVEKLKNENLNIKYITARYKGSKNKEKIDGVEYIRIGNSITLYLLALIYYIFNLRKNTDLLIENFNAVPFNIPLYNRNNITIIHHLQDTEWVSTYGKLIGKAAAFFFTNMLSLVYKRERSIITVSPSSRDDLISKGFKKENISIIYNGIDTKVLDRASKDNSTIKIVSLGRVKSTKYIDEAIEMVQYSVEVLGIKNLVLNIAGKGEDEDRLKKIVKEKSLDRYVKFLGYISEEEKENLLKEAHLHVQFSRKEGWGITVIEAAAKGTPTICYPVAGLIDSVTENTGYFIRGPLQETWRKAIEEITNNSENYRNRQEECLIWARKFKWDNQLDLFLEKVEEKLSNSSESATVNTEDITNKKVR